MGSHYWSLWIYLLQQVWWFWPLVFDKVWNTLGLPKLLVPRKSKTTNFPTTNRRYYTTEVQGNSLRHFNVTERIKNILFLGFNLIVIDINMLYMHVLKRNELLPKVYFTMKKDNKSKMKRLRIICMCHCLYKQSIS
jgi:hypothetical protein